MKKIILIGAILLIVSVFYYYDTFYMVNDNLTDRITITQNVRSVDERIKILAIDDESLEAIGKWPWPRDVIAHTVDNLLENGAKAVFVDVLYTETSQNTQEDKVWQEVISKHQNLYLPSYFQFDEEQQAGEHMTYKRLNRPAFTIPFDQTAHINVLEDKDKVVRQILLGVPIKEDKMMPAMSVKIANNLLSPSERVSWHDNAWYQGSNKIEVNNKNQVIFSYATKPQSNELGEFEVVPIHLVVNGYIDPLYFENAIVLIGPYTVGLQDTYQTPMSKTQPMYGIEIHANMVQALLDHEYYVKSSRGLGLIILLMTVVIGYLVMDLVKAKWAILVLIGFSIVYYQIVTLFYQSYHLLLPFFYVILGFIFSYISSVVNHYIKEQREKKRVTTIFGRYVSKNIVNDILSQKEEIKLGGVRKEVSLLFVDIRGFTPLSEKIQPEEVIQILNEYLDLCAKAIFEVEGTIDKFIGDAVMAIFGAPIAQEDHAERAVKAALVMKKKSNELSKTLLEKYGRTVGFGIGINSGPAVIGNIGSKDRLDYTAIGDTVNLAARLESNAKPGQILISEETYQLVKGKFTITELEAIKVKGKEQPVKIYQVEEGV